MDENKKELNQIIYKKMGIFHLFKHRDPVSEDPQLK